MFTDYNWQTFLTNLQNLQALEWSIVGVALFLLLFFYYLAKRPPKTIPAFRNDAGKTEITRKALEELIKTSCAQFSSVRKSKSSIQLKGGYLHILIKIKLEGPSHLSEVTTSLQNHLQDVLVNQMGITKMGKINVSVIGIKSYGVKKTTPAPAKETEKELNKTSDLEVEDDELFSEEDLEEKPKF